MREPGPPPAKALAWKPEEASPAVPSRADTRHMEWACEKRAGQGHSGPPQPPPTLSSASTHRSPQATVQWTQIHASNQDAWSFRGMNPVPRFLLLLREPDLQPVADG